MPDPIDELDNFSIPGPPMNPLPASEVRRRGNRIRRRNNALATVGALAVVAAIATPFAVAAGGSGQSQQDVGPADQPPGGWVRTVPAGFDLGAVPDGADPAFRFETGQQPAVDDLTACGEPVYSSDGAADTAGATWRQAGSEGSAGRTLALYASDTEAEAALADLGAAVQDCPRDEVSGELPTVNDVVDTPVPGAESAFVWTRQVQDGELLYDQTVYQAVQVGNALYLAYGFSSAGGPQAQQNVDVLIANSAPVVDQLCTFSLEGCATETPTEAVDEPTGLTGAIPDDFPVAEGLPSGGALDGPAHEIELAPYNLDNTLRACGVRPGGLPAPVDTLYAGHRTPAEGILRQLMTFDSADEAQAYVDGTIAPFADCPEDTSDARVTRLYEVTNPDLGDDTAVAAMRVEVDGEPGIGYQFVQVTRVGQAVLLSVVINDGDPFDTDLASSYLLDTEPVVEAMG